MMFVCGGENNKKAKLPKGLKHIIVGEKKVRKDNYCYDDSGENIASLNSQFCELTAMYWIRKNNKDEYKGLCHYRRFFYKNYYAFFKIMSESQLIKALEGYDAIAIKKYPLEDSLYNLYAKSHDIEDLDFCLKYIEEKDESYRDDIAWFKQQNSGYFCNMFFSSKKFFDDYCLWLFDILFALKNKNKDKIYKEAYQNRVYGFLSERLFNIYIKHFNFKIKELDFRLSSNKYIFKPYPLIVIKNRIKQIVK